MRWMAWTLTFLALMASAAAPLGQGDADSASEDGFPDCPATDPATGAPVTCRDGLGMLEVFAPDGHLLGLSHGPDPAWLAAAPLSVTALARAPVCVEEPAAQVEPHTRVIYARAHDDADGYAAKVGTIRSLVASANGVLYDAAVATGTPAAIKVHCNAGTTTVDHAVLPTDMADADFETIFADLEAQGYDSPHVKYWVYYDDRGACVCGGIALLYLDDGPGPINLNNGFAPFPQFAVNFDYNSVRIMLHELAHTMGAVQPSAPHGTSYAHCTDGLDIMCYRDGSPEGEAYTTSVCSSAVFDCNHDDYFHTNPAPGSYLDTHWNLGSRWNRFLDFDDTMLVGPV